MVTARAARLLRHPVTVATLAAAVAHLLWFFTLANSGGDLAAQDAWAEFAGRHPDSAYNLAWYGGMHPVSYSAVSPYVMSVLGVRTTMMIAGTVSSALLAAILVRSRVVRKPLWPALAGVFALLCNSVSGRVTFGLGLTFALAATAVAFGLPARTRPRRWAKAALAAALAGLATACSPVAGLYVGLAAVALFAQKRRPAAYALGLAPLAVVALSAWLFPFSGTQPMSGASALLPVVFGVLVALLVPKEWKTVRVTAAIDSLTVLLAWAVSSQVGSNITRLAMLFAGAALLAALPFAVPRSRRWYAIAAAFAGFVVWVGAKTADDVVRTTPTAAWTRELAPLVHQLREAGAERGRVEVVPVRSHREASALAPYVNLARGWNRQADMGRNPLFYDGPLDAAGYRAWLDRWAVRHVVLPADAPDVGGEHEADLVRRGLPYLKKTWSDGNWQLFTVTDPTPLAGPHARVVRAEQDEVTIDVAEPGRILVRIPYSPWLSVVDADGNPQKEYRESDGCLEQVPENSSGDRWTELRAPRPGVYRLAAPYQLPRGTPCPDESR